MIRSLAPAPRPSRESSAASGSRYGEAVRVREIWRFPVKSMQSERLDAAEVEPQGLRGDRAFALFDTQTGFGLTARRVPQLLFAAAVYRDDGGVTITLPNGTTADDDQALSDWLARPVTLRAAAEPGERVFENPADFEHDARWEPFNGSTGAFHDSGQANVSLLSLATIAAGRGGASAPTSSWTVLARTRSSAPGCASATPSWRSANKSNAAS
jgi:uncharacterized protein YcbX